MDDVTRMLAAVSEEPGSDLAWSALADALEEAGKEREAELTRLTLALSQGGEVWNRSTLLEKRRVMERRRWELLRQGVRPVRPFFTNAFGMRFVLVSAPQPFWMADMPISKRQAEKAGRTLRLFGRKEGKTPALLNVSEVGNLLTGLNKGAEVTHFGLRYMLPTRVQWETACHGGNAWPYPYFWGDRLETGDAAFDGDGTRVPGTRPPNAFGLYDMHGLVWEMAWDEPVWVRKGGSRTDRRWHCETRRTEPVQEANGIRPIFGVPREDG